MRVTIRGSYSLGEITVEKPENPVSAPGLRNGLLRVSVLRLMTAACLMAVVLMSTVIGVISIFQIAKGVGNRDFIAYWTAGQLMIRGSDPYDQAATLKVELAAGWTGEGFEIMRNPPVSFFLVAPLGLVSARTGATMWCLLLVSCLAAAIRLLWISFDRQENYLHLLCLCFPPVLTCLSAGQMGIILLLGISLFLYFYASRPFLAGMALLVCAFKPHLFLPFGLVLLLWVIYRRQYRVLAGFAAGVLAACVFALWMDPHAFSQYSRMMTIAQPSEHPFVPTLSKMFRLVVHPESVWLQYVPALAGIGWAAWYFLSRRNTWRWLDHGLLLLIVSLGCAPYAWFTDESVLVPAMLVGLYRTHASGRSLLPFALICGVLFAELFNGNWITTPYFVWSVPAWLAWYIYTSRGHAELEAAHLSNTLKV